MGNTGRSPYRSSTRLLKSQSFVQQDTLKSLVGTQPITYGVGDGVYSYKTDQMMQYMPLKDGNYDVQVSALQLQLIESLDLLKRKDNSVLVLEGEVDRLNKVLKSCLYIQDKMMVDCFKMQRKAQLEGDKTEKDKNELEIEILGLKR